MLEVEARWAGHLIEQHQVSSGQLATLLQDIEERFDEGIAFYQHGSIFIVEVLSIDVFRQRSDGNGYDFVSMIDLKR